ncbi:hypothetical protein [Streptomyces muensis]|uniref:Uncharacterized protein n=1 Tax=Streptomyces muensis TaxID=1077944 RepID=A0A9X1Q257_STRM4|nr:hypothetical protein [Streptomyces muensis]MCF1596675.1 hypothetical protein [Streptomyces muensis]
MNEQDSDSLDSLRDSSSFELRIKTAESMVEVLEILHEHDLSEEDFTNRFPVLAKLFQGLPNETAPPG